MRFIVDANTVFSTILNTNGKIGDIQINGGMRFDFIAIKEDIRFNHLGNSRSRISNI